MVETIPINYDDNLPQITMVYLAFVGIHTKYYIFEILAYRYSRNFKYLYIYFCEVE